MSHRTSRVKLGRTRRHRRALLRNLLRSLFIHERIMTTLDKARAARPEAERLVSFARRGTLAARREVLAVVPDPAVVGKLFADIAPRYGTTASGFVRIIRTAPRVGDGAEQALLELVIRKEKPARREAAREKAKEKPAARPPRRKAKAAEE